MSRNRFVYWSLNLTIETYFFYQRVRILIFSDRCFSGKQNTEVFYNLITIIVVLTIRSTYIDTIADQ
jgi:hypothetical protein